MSLIYELKYKFTLKHPKTRLFSLVFVMKMLKKRIFLTFPPQEAVFSAHCHASAERLTAAQEEDCQEVGAERSDADQPQRG